MKKLFELGNKYASRSTWKDFALVKLCMLSMGLIFGANISEKYRKPLTAAAFVLFAATYIPLMAKLAKVISD